MGKMNWVGLTGGIGSGKSTVSRIIRELQFPLIDADELAREVVAPGTIGLDQVIQKFGRQLLNPDQSLNRRAMASEVFNDPGKLASLESILHPLIQERVRSFRQVCEENGSRIAFYDVPLLFEKSLQEQFDAILVVNALPNEIRKRLKARNQWSDDEINQRLAAQVPLEQKTKMADIVIENSGSLEELRIKVTHAIEELKKRFKI